MTLVDAIRNRMRKLAADRRGVSAVEFALILPIMMVLYAGTFEISEVLAVERKQTRVASTVADLVSQRTNVTAAEMDNIFDASTAIMSPYDTSGLKVQLIVVDVTSTKQTVAWSRAENDITYAAGANSPITIPDDIAIPGTQMVVSRARYTYQSPFSSLMQSITGRTSYELEDIYMMRPRIGTKITASG